MLLSGGAIGGDDGIEVEIALSERVLFVILLAEVHVFVKCKIEAKGGGIELALEESASVGGCSAVLDKVEALLDAFMLELLEFGDIGFALIAETAFLQGEVAEVFSIGEEDLSVDEVFAVEDIGFGGKLVGQFAAADGVDAGFERGDAVQTPFGVGNNLHEGFFSVGRG